MRITYIKLVNVASLYTGSNVNTLELDFSNTHSNIILITGPNGCGKTTLESCLHPFAYNGSGDDRSSESLIIKKKDGYKEVHITDGVNEYVIKHFYTASGENSHSVKSYISKNDVELNSNGNVTSFKEWVQIELGMTMEYLKLVRLGPNMTNFIDMKPTERKSYVGTMLNETEIYLKKLKKVTGDIKVLKAMIAQDVNRLNKLNISDISAEESYLERLRTKELKNIEDVISNISSRGAVIKSKLQEIGKSTNAVYAELEDSKHMLSDMSSQLKNRKFKILSDNDSTENIQEKLIQYTSKQEALKARRSMLINDADNCSNDLSELYIRKDKLDNNEDIKSLIGIIRDLDYEIGKDKETYKNFNPGYTASDINELLSLLDKWQSMLSATYEIGEKPIKKVAKLMAKSENVDGYISRKLDTISSNNITNRSSEVLSYLRKKFPSLNKKLKPKCGDSSCQYVQLIDSILELSEKDTDKNVESEEFYSYMQIAYSNISAVRNEMTQHNELFSRMPEKIMKMFTIEEFFSHIGKLEFIYDKTVINTELTIITEYELYLDKIKRLEKAKKELKSLTSSQGSDFVNERISELEERLNDDKENIATLTEKIEELDEKISDIRHLNETKTEYEALNSDFDKENQNFKTLTETWNNMREYNDELQTLSKRYEQADKEKKRIIDNITAVDSRIKMHYSLTKELKKIKKEYDEREMTRYSLSSKEGIPLIYINLYLKKTKKIVNELLDIVYGGELRITDFEVSADAFNIPYEKNGNVVSDAHYASQGEMSFLSTILSFALSMQSIVKYNIMLLDEVDGALDETNRKNFILVLDHLMKKIGAEQVFLITHNNMFDMYDVSTIDLTHISNGSIIIK